MGIATASVYLVVIAFGFVLDYLYQFRMSNTDLLEFFTSKQQHIHIGNYESHGRAMRYLYTDDHPGKPAILFIHGAPSSSSYYRDYLANKNLRASANLFAVDRAGYGYSGLGYPEPDIQKQAAMIAPIFDSLHRNQRPVIIVAASYGTSIASRLAMDYPHLVDGMVLLAPSLAPGEEKTYSISYVLESPFFTWAQPRMIHSANVEKLAHTDELKKMLPRWSEIKVPIIYLQGEKDDLIYTSNARFAQSQLKGAQSLSVRMLPGLGHLIAFKAKKEIMKAIEEMAVQSEEHYAKKSGDGREMSNGMSANVQTAANAAIQ
jgi:pimeloyl-ACP methyl ester carboxylesterase